ncbi:MAG: hypothetical protein ACE5MB_10350 [Anaerolineae bacterium]
MVKNTRDDEIVLISEVETLYPDEWLLFEVVETDEMNRPIKGRLLAHTPDRELAEEAFLEAEAEHVYFYYNGEPLPKGMSAAL